MPAGQLSTSMVDCTSADSLFRHLEVSLSSEKCRQGRFAFVESSCAAYSSTLLSIIPPPTVPAIRLPSTKQCRAAGFLGC
ncbi:MAG: hypothetical protein MZV63_01400 [Marinilabiliales bacterium]|nr:hypothetical protein [Marinilabiliales bacterium]